MCVDFLLKLSSAIEFSGVLSQKYIHLHLQYPLFFSDFNETVLYRFSKNTEVSVLMKLHPVGAALFHADSQTQ
jgi:hypothetical protein